MSGSRAGRASTDTVLKFEAIKHLAVTGRTSTERDALMYLGGGLISIVGRPGGTIFGTFNYKDLGSITYVHLRDPRWNETLPSPPPNLDVGGPFRATRHWLVLQSRTTYAILRLEDGNWKSVIDSLQARTGIVVFQPVR